MRKRLKNEKRWMIAKSIKFDKKKLKEAKEKNRIKELPEMCRQQLDILISG